MIRRFLSLMLLFAVTGECLSAIAAEEPLSPKQRAQLLEAAVELQHEAERLREELPNEQVIADVAVCGKAVEWIVRHNEFYKPSYVEWTHSVLEQGQQRLKAASADGELPLPAGQSTACGYRSKVDQSYQPYALTLPAGYDPASGKRWPVHLVLHGRNGTLTEASFIHQWQGKPAPEDQDWIQIDVFGRTNNAFRWAGETDVFEALADARRRVMLDDSRIALWGFSMGGAGAWHIGLHHPSKFCAAGAGAGFVDFYKYQKVDEKLPPFQDEALRIYDVVHYAENLAMIPFVTYGGEKDSQLVASTTVAELAKEHDVPLTLLIGKDAGHKFTPEAKAEFMAFLRTATDRGRPRFPAPSSLQFVTHTLKYNSCEWVTIEEQLLPYEKTTVKANVDDIGLLNVATENIALLQIDRGVADFVRLDDEQPLPLRSAADGLLPGVYYQKTSEGWKVLGYGESREWQRAEGNPRKRHNLQGPIDDAFMEPFVCVTGSAEPQSPELGQWSNWTLDRFEREFDKWMRGKPVVVSDTELIDEQAARQHLILFGDPASNRILREIADDLPVRWEKDQFTIGDRSFDTKTHGFAMIYPNPRNPLRYVVINSGHTFHEPQFKASNAQLYPRMGDLAVVKFTPDGDGFQEEIVWGINFDANWQIPAKTSTDE